MFTFQDFEIYKTQSGVATAIEQAVQRHKGSQLYLTALDANRYDRQQNTTIMSYAHYLYTADGRRYTDPLASNFKLCSNFFHQLNTQRVTYSLGNGVTFGEESTKGKLGINFDTMLKNAGYYALIHGVSFLFWNVDHAHIFPLSEFCPLYDEETGALRAGVRFWSIDTDKPVTAVLYEEDGFTKFVGDSAGTTFKVTEAKRAYRLKTVKADSAEPEVIGEENYTSLPIVPVWGSKLKQSTLVGLKSKIDAYDLISSGMADTVKDCATIYWLVSNAGGMDTDDLAEFRQRLNYTHIANVENSRDVAITPYTQEPPTNSTMATLTALKEAIYEDFGGLDIHTIQAGATNDHIDAAYQALDMAADDFEYQIIDAVQALLALMGVKDTPLFKRNRLSNYKEQTEVLMLAAQYLDEEFILDKLPYVTPEEANAILDRRVETELTRFIPQSQQM